LAIIIRPEKPLENIQLANRIEVKIDNLTNYVENLLKHPYVDYKKLI
jgi:hypothetical protein